MQSRSLVPHLSEYLELLDQLLHVLLGRQQVDARPRQLDEAGPRQDGVAGGLLPPAGQRRHHGVQEPVTTRQLLQFTLHQGQSTHSVSTEEVHGEIHNEGHLA